MIADVVAVMTADVTLPLMADVQYMEPYGSAAFNRKLRNILLPGFFSGFNPEPSEGLKLKIVSPDSGGAASIDVNGSQITVQQLSDVSLTLPAGAVSIIVLEANYNHGVKTTQVDSDSTVHASQIFATTNAALADNQIEICRVDVPAGTTQLDASMIDLSHRVNRGIGIQLSSEITSERDDVAASSHAVKKLHDMINSIEIPTGTTTQPGIVQLSNSVDSDSESHAATSKAVKIVSDELASVKKGLGTASGKEVVTSNTDTTEGRLLIVGWQGLGAVSGPSYSDANTPNVNCFFRMNAEGIHGPVANAPSNILQFQYDANAGQQIGYRAGAENAPMQHRTKINAVWGEWAQVFDTKNPPTAEQVDAVSASKGGTFQKEVAFSEGVKIRSGTGIYPGDDAAGFTSNNMLLKSWYGIGFYCTLTDGEGLTGYINTRNGQLEMKGQIIPGDYANFDERFIKLTGSANITGSLRCSSEFQTTSMNSYRMVAGSYGTFWRQDGSKLYLMLTNSGDLYGSYNSLRPFYVDLATGNPVMSQLALSDYANFDARYYTKTLSDAGYMAKTGAYTKAESDARYQLASSADTYGISGNILWSKNGKTGVIRMTGITDNVANSGRVAFPFSFPTKCYSVVANRHNSTGNAAAMQPYDITTTGWNLRIAGGGTESVTWTAEGI